MASGVSRNDREKPEGNYILIAGVTSDFPKGCHPKTRKKRYCFSKLAPYDQSATLTLLRQDVITFINLFVLLHWGM